MLARSWPLAALIDGVATVAPPVPPFGVMGEMCCRGWLSTYGAAGSSVGAAPGSGPPAVVAIHERSCTGAELQQIPKRVHPGQMCVGLLATSKDDQASSAVFGSLSSAGAAHLSCWRAWCRRGLLLLLLLMLLASLVARASAVI